MAGIKIPYDKKAERERYKLKYPNKERNRYYKKYNITVEDYDFMLTQQNNCCAICKAKRPGGKGLFHVDHNHITGMVRGLLCMKCNKGIGLLQDSIIILQNAINYLSTPLPAGGADRKE